MFSLGILLFELATDLNLPTEGNMWHDLRDGRAMEYMKNVADKELVNLIVRLTNPSSRKRLSAQDLLEQYKPRYGCHCIGFPPPPSASAARRGSCANLSTEFLAACEEL